MSEATTLTKNFKSVFSQSTVRRSESSEYAAVAIEETDVEPAISARPLLSKQRYYAFSILLAITSASFARLYALVLHYLVRVVWLSIPTHLGGAAGPWYTLFVCTVGGGAVALLASALPKGYGVGNWITDTAERSGGAAAEVAAVSGAAASGSVYPGLPSLGTVVVLSLLCSACGFSLGPEGPMVCVGGILGSSLAEFLLGCDHGNHSAAFLGEAGAGLCGDSDAAARRSLVRAFSITGAAAALSSFLGGMPLVGAVFATELLGPTAALGGGDGDGPASPSSSSSAASNRPPFFSSAVLATIVATVVADASKSAVLGGDFDYAFGRDPSLQWSAALILPAVAVGVVGGALSSALTYAVKFVKNASALFISGGGGGGPPRCLSRRVAVCSVAGFAVGLVGVLWPYTLLWGETRVGALLKREPFDQSLAPSLNAWAVTTNPERDCRQEVFEDDGGAMDTEFGSGGGSGGTAGASSLSLVACPLTPMSELQIGVMKLVSISIAVGAGLPGGVIYPLFFAAAALAKGAVGLCEEASGVTLFGIHVPWWGALSSSSSSSSSPPMHPFLDEGGGDRSSSPSFTAPEGASGRHDNFGPVATVCLMSALQAATTRTPLATVFMLAMASAPAADNTAALLPAMATGAYVGVWTAQAFGVSFFEYPK